MSVTSMMKFVQKLLGSFVFVFDLLLEATTKSNK